MTLDGNICAASAPLGGISNFVKGALEEKGMAAKKRAKKGKKKAAKKGTKSKKGK